MLDYKLGFGPMSIEIAEIICQWTIDRDFPLMIIASRNQVDRKNSYVCTTRELRRLISASGSKKVLMCRDHCGPYFKDDDRNLSLIDAIAAVKETIDEDIENGIDVIHVDISRIKEDPFSHGQEIIEYILSQKSEMFLEFGAEENIGTSSEIEILQQELEFVKQFSKNILFMVSQTGSLVKETQVGRFDMNLTSLIAEEIHSHGYRLKEHNADYLTSNEIIKRKISGIDALNIAPQLGCMQTLITMKLALKHGNINEWNDFCNHVINGNRWERWKSLKKFDPLSAVISAGHYHFNTRIYKKIISKIGKDEFLSEMKAGIYNILDGYQEFCK